MTRSTLLALIAMALTADQALSQGLLKSKLALHQGPVSEKKVFVSDFANA
jgi:hypothetical protein